MVTTAIQTVETDVKTVETVETVKTYVETTNGRQPAVGTSDVGFHTFDSFDNFDTLYYAFDGK